MTQVLVVDDEQIVRDLIVEILEEAGYAAVGVDSTERALESLADPSIDLVVSDIMMPGANGFDFLAQARAARPSLPVVMMTGAGTHANLSAALALGADGLVMKPFSHADLLSAVATAFDRARRGEAELRKRLLTPTLAGALANAIEARESSLHGHCERLAELAVRLGLELSLPDATIETIRLGAILHDAGKIGIPDRILLKPGPLDDEEYALMKTHTLIGDRLLEPIEELQAVRPVVRHHHEHWDGAGYPDGLAGEDIPLPARVVAVADAVEAMSAQRIHRTPWGRDRIVEELCTLRGRQWDPAAVDATLALIDRGELLFPEGGLVVAARAAPGPGAPRQLPVLLVGENAHDAELARGVLERALADVAVSHAPDLATARRLCSDSCWSLVVVRDDLPDGAGLDLVQTLRDAAPDLPVLVLTGQGAQTAAAEAYRGRASAGVVAKGPTFLDELSGRVRALLQVASA